MANPMTNPKGLDVLVIPASSVSGEACIRDLTTKFPEVKIAGAYRSFEKANEAKKQFPQIDVIEGVDALNKTTLDNIFAGHSHAVIVTPHTGNFENDATANINLINAALEQKVGHIIWVGSWTVGLEKARQIANRFQPVEDILKAQTGSNWTVLRGGYFMSNLLQHAAMVKTEQKIAIPDVGFGMPMVDNKDIGRSAAAVIGKNDPAHVNKAFEMTGPERLTAQDVAAALSKALGKEIQGIPVPVNIAVTKVPPFIGEILTEVQEKGANSIPFTTDIKDLTGDHTTFERWLADNKAGFQ